MGIIFEPFLKPTVLTDSPKRSGEGVVRGVVQKSVFGESVFFSAP